LRFATLLRYFRRGHSYAQIALLCDVPVGTVRSRLHQAKAELGKQLLQQIFGRPRAGVEWARRVARAHEAFEVGDPGPYVEMFSRDASLRGGAIEVRGTDDIGRVCDKIWRTESACGYCMWSQVPGSPWWRRSSSTHRTTRTIARQTAQTFSSMTVATWRAALTPISNQRTDDPA